MTNPVMMEDAGYSKGMIPRDYARNPVGSLAFAPQMQTKVKLIPRTEWADRIKEKDANRSWIWDRCQKIVPRLDQKDFSWCWNHGPTGAAMCSRAMAGLSFKLLSPSSLGWVVNWDKDAGEYIQVAMKAISEVGIAEASIVPMLTNNKQYWNDAAKANAARHKLRCLDLDTNVYDEIITCALMDIVTVWGINDWDHCTYGGVKARWNPQTKRVELMGVNSWGNWNVDGTYWTGERLKHYPNEAYALLVPDAA